MNPIILVPQYLTEPYRTQVLKEILSFKPIWENRFSKSNPPPPGELNRQLLRPVYWLGNWQFACLNYYHPPKGIENRCVQGEDYPPLMKKIVQDIEHQVRDLFSPKDVPEKWHLNTCLINYYGSKIQDGKKIDAARVGEHKDFEPGPVASLSFGERAMFQFVRSHGKNSPSEVALQQWLDDGTLQVFGGEKYKSQLFHRVQRVEKNKGKALPSIQIPDFETRRINLTFRYVPDEHIKPFRDLPENLRLDILCYTQELAEHSEFWKSQITSVSK